MPAKLLGAAAEYIEKRYGGGMAETVAVESVGTTQSQVVRNDPERVFALLVNLSTNTIYIGYDQSVSASRGIVISPSGGTYQVDVEEDFILPNRSLYAVATGAGSSLYVLTVRRISKTVVEAA